MKGAALFRYRVLMEQNVLPAVDRAHSIQRAASRPGALLSIQYLRALAALMVTAYHVSHFISEYRGAKPFLGWDALGLYGVSIFFAISGYLMATLVRRTDPWVFMAHRLVRIYPTFLIVFAICVTLAIAAGEPFPFDPIGASLVPAGERFYALRVEWTLLFEVTFYVALFAVSLAGWTRWLERGVLTWLTLLLACSVVFPGWNHEATPPAYRLPLLPACTGFAAGLLIPAALRMGSIPRWTFAAALLLALVSVGLPIGDSRFVSGILAALMVAGILRSEPRVARPALDPLKKVGDWSYALYLCHVPIILVALRLAPLQMNPVLLWFCTIAACLAASALIGTLDVRLYRVSKQMVDRAGSGPLHRLVAGYLALFTAIGVYGAVDTALRERRSGQERAILSRIPADALRRRETARIALEAAGLLAPPYLRGEVTEVAWLDGALIVRGWLFDEADTQRRPSAAIFYNGVELKVTQPSRKRPAIAALLGRPDLAKAGLGFGIAHRMACVPGAEVVVVGLDLAGVAAVLPGKAIIDECP